MTNITYRLRGDVKLRSIASGTWFTHNGSLYLLAEDLCSSIYARAFRAHDQLFVSFSYDTPVYPVKVNEIIVGESG